MDPKHICKTPDVSRSLFDYRSPIPSIMEEKEESPQQIDTPPNQNLKTPPSKRSKDFMVGYSNNSKSSISDWLLNSSQKKVRHEQIDISALSKSLMTDVKKLKILSIFFIIVEEKLKIQTLMLFKSSFESLKSVNQALSMKKFGFLKLSSTLNRKQKELKKEFMTKFSEQFAKKFKNYMKGILSNVKRSGSLSQSKQAKQSNVPPKLSILVSKMLKLTRDLINDQKAEDFKVSSKDLNLLLILQRGFNLVSFFYQFQRKKSLQTAFQTILKRTVQSIPEDDITGVKDISHYSIILHPALDQKSNKPKTKLLRTPTRHNKSHMDNLLNFSQNSSPIPVHMLSQQVIRVGEVSSHDLSSYYESSINISPEKRIEKFHTKLKNLSLILNKKLPSMKSRHLHKFLQYDQALFQVFRISENSRLREKLIAFQKIDTFVTRKKAFQKILNNLLNLSKRFRSNLMLKSLLRWKDGGRQSGDQSAYVKTEEIAKKQQKRRDFLRELKRIAVIFKKRLGISFEKIRDFVDLKKILIENKESETKNKIYGLVQVLKSIFLRKKCYGLRKILTISHFQQKEDKNSKDILKEKGIHSLALTLKFSTQRKMYRILESLKKASLISKTKVIESHQKFIKLPIMIKSKNLSNLNKTLRFAYILASSSKNTRKEFALKHLVKIIKSHNRLDKIQILNRLKNIKKKATSSLKSLAFVINSLVKIRTNSIFQRLKKNKITEDYQKSRFYVEGFSLLSKILVAKEKMIVKDVFFNLIIHEHKEAFENQGKFLKFLRIFKKSYLLKIFWGFSALKMHLNLGYLEFFISKRLFSQEKLEREKYVETLIEKIEKQNLTETQIINVLRGAFQNEDIDFKINPKETQEEIQPLRKGEINKNEKKLRNKDKRNETISENENRDLNTNQKSKVNENLKEKNQFFPAKNEINQNENSKKSENIERNKFPNYDDRVLKTGDENLTKKEKFMPKKEEKLIASEKAQSSPIEPINKFEQAENLKLQELMNIDHNEDVLPVEENVEDQEFDIGRNRAKKDKLLKSKVNKNSQKEEEGIKVNKLQNNTVQGEERCIPKVDETTPIKQIQASKDKLKETPSDNQSNYSAKEVKTKTPKKENVQKDIAKKDLSKENREQDQNVLNNRQNDKEKIISGKISSDDMKTKFNFKDNENKFPLKKNVETASKDIPKQIPIIKNGEEDQKINGYVDCKETPSEKKQNIKSKDPKTHLLENEKLGNMQKEISKKDPGEIENQKKSNSKGIKTNQLEKHQLETGQNNIPRFASNETDGILMNKIQKIKNGEINLNSEPLTSNLINSKKDSKTKIPEKEEFKNELTTEFNKKDSNNENQTEDANTLHSQQNDDDIQIDFQTREPLENKQKFKSKDAKTKITDKKHSQNSLITKTEPEQGNHDGDGNYLINQEAFPKYQDGMVDKHIITPKSVGETSKRSGEVAQKEPVSSSFVNQKKENNNKKTQPKIEDQPKDIVNRNTDKNKKKNEGIFQPDNSKADIAEFKNTSSLNSLIESNETGNFENTKENEENLKKNSNEKNQSFGQVGKNEVPKIPEKVNKNPKKNQETLDSLLKIEEKISEDQGCEKKNPRNSLKIDKTSLKIKSNNEIDAENKILMSKTPETEEPQKNRLNSISNNGGNIENPQSNYESDNQQIEGALNTDLMNSRTEANKEFLQVPKTKNIKNKSGDIVKELPFQSANPQSISKKNDSLGDRAALENIIQPINSVEILLKQPQITKIDQRKNKTVETGSAKCLPSKPNYNRKPSTSESDSKYLIKADQEDMRDQEPDPNDLVEGDLNSNNDKLYKMTENSEDNYEISKELIKNKEIPQNQNRNQLHENINSTKNKKNKDDDKKNENFQQGFGVKAEETEDHPQFTNKINSEKSLRKSQLINSSPNNQSGSILSENINRSQNEKNMENSMRIPTKENGIQRMPSISDKITSKIAKKPSEVSIKSSNKVEQPSERNAKAPKENDLLKIANNDNLSSENKIQSSQILIRTENSENADIDGEEPAYNRANEDEGPYARNYDFEEQEKFNEEKHEFAKKKKNSGGRDGEEDLKEMINQTAHLNNENPVEEKYNHKETLSISSTNNKFETGRGDDTGIKAYFEVVCPGDMTNISRKNSDKSHLKSFDLTVPTPQIKSKNIDPNEENFNGDFEGDDKQEKDKKKRIKNPQNTDIPTPEIEQIKKEPENCFEEAIQLPENIKKSNDPNEDLTNPEISNYIFEKVNQFLALELEKNKILIDPKLEKNSNGFAVNSQGENPQPFNLPAEFENKKQKQSELVDPFLKTKEFQSPSNDYYPLKNKTNNSSKFEPYIPISTNKQDSTQNNLPLKEYTAKKPIETIKEEEYYLSFRNSERDGSFPSGVFGISDKSLKSKNQENLELKPNSRRSPNNYQSSFENLFYTSNSQTRFYKHNNYNKPIVPVDHQATKDFMNEGSFDEVDLPCRSLRPINYEEKEQIPLDKQYQKDPLQKHPRNFEEKFTNEDPHFINRNSNKKVILEKGKKPELYELFDDILEHRFESLKKQRQISIDLTKYKKDNEIREELHEENCFNCEFCGKNYIKDNSFYQNILDTTEPTIPQKTLNAEFLRNDEDLQPERNLNVEYIYD